MAVLNRYKHGLMRWCARQLGSFLAVIVAISVFGQPAPAPLSTVNRVEEILKLTSEEANRQYPVDLSGTVVLYDTKYNLFFIHDGEASIYVFATKSYDVHPGQKLRLKGVTKSGRYTPILVLEALEVLGEGAIPKARETTPDRMFSGAEDAQWVRLQGIVHSDSSPLIEPRVLSVGEGAASFRVSVLGPARSQTNSLVDSQVLVEGVATPVYDDRNEVKGFQIFAPSIASVRVLKAGIADPFLAPLRQVDDFNHHIPADLVGHRMRIAGTITADLGERGLFLQDRSGAIQVLPTDPAAVKVAVGDPVEASGFAEATQARLRLVDARLRITGPTVPLAATNVSLAEFRDPKNLNRLVRVTGTVEDTLRMPGNGVMVSLLTGGTLWRAQVPLRDLKSGLELLKRGTQVALTGIALPTPIGGGMVREPLLLLRSLEDVKVVRRVPWWEQPWTMAGLFFTLLLATVAIGLVAHHARLKLMQRNLREKEQSLEARYRELFDNANDIIYSHDLSGRILSMNRAAIGILGYTPEEALHLSVPQLVAPSDWNMAREMMDRKLKGEGRTVYELNARTKDGRAVVLEINSRLEYENDKPVKITGIARDITARKYNEELLKRSEQHTRHALEMRERIARDLHDGLIQTIYAVGLALEHCRTLILDDPKAADEQLRRSLGDLNQGIRELRSFITGLDPTGSHTRDFKTAMDALVKSMRLSPTNQFGFDLDPGASEALTPHQQGHLLQVAREALSNSLRHAHASTTMVLLIKDSGALRFEVMDDGVGFRTDRVHSEGFGLRNMRYRAGELDANFRIISKPHEGTRIILEFPYDKDEQPNETTPHPAPDRG